jgi:5S rRNA maturation endonuclease (ribonuclease M5)
MSLDSSNDLGLSLEQPDGQTISFLDVGKHKNILFDMDESGNKQSIKLNNPVKGKYNLFIEEYETINGEESTKYDITVNYKDGTKDNFEGVINKGQEKTKVGEFEI